LFLTLTAKTAVRRGHPEWMSSRRTHVLRYRNLMRFPLLALISSILVCAAFGQNTTNTAAKTPKDPRELLAAARPAYDFDDASLKPWHLKGKYQLFDENGKPGQEGKYEYWWTAPGVYRSTWSRPGGMRTEWHTADGKTMSVASGRRILAMERELRSFLVSAVPDVSKIPSNEADIEKDELKLGNLTLPCAEVKTRKQKEGSQLPIPDIGAGEYCFDSPGIYLRVRRITTREYVEFDHLMRAQEHVIAGEITRSFERRTMFKFTLEGITHIDRADPAMTPTTDAALSADDVGQTTMAVTKRLLNTVPPIYPLRAKIDRVTGTVLMDVLIGRDGRVGDVVVVASSSPLLSPAARDAVAQWKYSPYVVDGQPLEVVARVRIIFSMPGRPGE